MADAVARITDVPDPDDEETLTSTWTPRINCSGRRSGRPLTVRVAGKVITVPHPTDWPHTANTAAARADFSAWAQAVLTDAGL